MVPERLWGGKLQYAECAKCDECRNKSLVSVFVFMHDFRARNICFFFPYRVFRNENLPLAIAMAYILQ